MDNINWMAFMGGINDNGWHSLIDGVALMDSINWTELLDGINGNGQHSLIDGINRQH